MHAETVMVDLHIRVVKLHYFHYDLFPKVKLLVLCAKMNNEYKNILCVNTRSAVIICYNADNLIHCILCTREMSAGRRHFDYHVVQMF